MLTFKTKMQPRLLFQPIAMLCMALIVIGEIAKVEAITRNKDKNPLRCPFTVDTKINYQHKLPAQTFNIQPSFAVSINLYAKNLTKEGKISPKITMQWFDHRR